MTDVSLVGPICRLAGMRAKMSNMIVKVAAEAVADAGFEPKDVDAVYLGHFNGGFSARTSPPAWYSKALTISASPATCVENACATGSARHQGLNLIAAKQRALCSAWVSSR